MPRASTMHLTEAVSIATSSLWAHKLRSVLTLIGVVIGVTSVIAVVSLINGANQYVATRVFRLGALLLIVASCGAWSWARWRAAPSRRGGNGLVDPTPQ
jgi:putative ABC transport system permease protein